MKALLKLTGSLLVGRDIQGTGNRVNKGTKATEYSRNRKMKSGIHIGTSQETKVENK